MKEFRKISIALILVFFTVASPAGHAASTVGDHAGATFSDAFDKSGIWILASGSAATLIAFGLDSSTHDAWVGNQRMDKSASKIGDFWGTGIPEALIAGTQIILDRENGIVNTEGLLSSAVVTHSMKFVVARERPDSTTRTAFPSGHASVAFASATSLALSYGWRAAIPGYGMAIFTGLSRLADNAHWLSDVVAGATVGILFGRAGFKHHFSVAPLVLDDGGRGGGLTVQLSL